MKYFLLIAMTAILSSCSIYMVDVPPAVHCDEKKIDDDILREIEELKEKVANIREDIRRV